MTRKFTEIGQLHEAVTSVHLRATFLGRDEQGNAMYRDLDDSDVLPIVRYRGTVKIHGENAGVRLVPETDDEPAHFVAQSRKTDLSLDRPSRGFAQHVLSESTLPVLWELFKKTDASVVYGEWCGPGIQRGEAIHQIKERTWVVFAIRKNDGSWAGREDLLAFDAPDHGIWSIVRPGIQTYEIDIDFNPGKIAACRDEVDRLTAEVEVRCPVAAHFGVEGTGEGIVWVPVDTETYDERFWFKSKAEKHKERAHRSKEKTPIAPEVMGSIEEFVEETANDVRLEKGFFSLLESLDIPEHALEKKHVGPFIKWVCQDILKEEAAVIEASGLDWTQLSAPVSRCARDWYFKRLDKMVIG